MWSEMEDEDQEPVAGFKDFINSLNLRGMPNFLNREKRLEIFPFTSDFTRRLLYNKHIVIIGDSLSRGIYKDLVGLLQTDSLVPEHLFKFKSESSHMHDRLIDHLPMEQDRVWRQAREYQTSCHLIQYLFTTRVMKNDMNKFLLTFQEQNEFPDVIIMNSALWDITRYGKNRVDMNGVLPYGNCPFPQIENEMVAMDEYVSRLAALCKRFRALLPPTTQVIWLCMPWTLPEGTTGFNARNELKDTKALQRSLCIDANFRAAQVVRAAGYDVLDLGFLFRNHAFYSLRIRDGVHWNSIGTRMMTQIVIARLSLNVKLPQEIKNRLIRFQQEGRMYGKEFLEAMNTNTHSKAEDQKGSYAEPLQRDLAETTLKELPAPVYNAIKKDVQVMRSVDLLRLHNLTLSEEDTVKLKEMAAAPRVKAQLSKDVPVQRIRVGARRAATNPDKAATDRGERSRSRAASRTGQPNEQGQTFTSMDHLSMPSTSLGGGYLAPDSFGCGLPLSDFTSGYSNPKPGNRKRRASRGRGRGRRSS